MISSALHFLFACFTVFSIPLERQQGLRCFSLWSHFCHHVVSFILLKQTQESKVFFFLLFALLKLLEELIPMSLQVQELQPIHTAQGNQLTILEWRPAKSVSDNSNPIHRNYFKTRLTSGSNCSKLQVLKKVTYNQSSHLRLLYHPHSYMTKIQAHYK